MPQPDQHEEPADETLMTAVQARDEAAYTVLVERHLQSLYRFAVRLGNEPDDAQDIAQEAFVRVWDKAAQWQPGRVKFTTWLFQIARNFSIDRHRRTARVQPLTDPNEFTAPESSHAANTRAAQQNAALTAAIAQLPERQRTALALCYFEGFSNQEAAAILAVKVDALESLLARARRRLTQELAAHAG